MISGFFNGQSVTAEDFATAFGGVMTNGVLADTQDALKVVPAGNMSVAISSGYCWIEGHFGNNETTTSLTLSNSDGVLNRIDRVIARLNRTLNLVQLLVLKGTLSATPTPPALVRDGTYYDLCLAEVKVDKGTTTITEDMITDTRNDSNLCGAVTLRSAFNFALDGKADKSVVEALTTVVDGKASTSAITNGTIKACADRLQGKPISTTAPTEGQMLKLISGVWTPKDSAKVVYGSGTFTSTSSVNSTNVSLGFVCTAYLCVTQSTDYTKAYAGSGSSVHAVSNYNQNTVTYYYIAIRE